MCWSSVAASTASQSPTTRLSADLTVALVERGDFGAATSFNHLRTVHGGLRYLQSADFVRMRESIRERRAFARIAPRFVAPLAFAMPTAARLTRNARRHESGPGA